MAALGDREIPLGRLHERVAAGRARPVARELVLANIGLVLADYDFATARA
ncbi:class II D-tagatose-bisphosphate aldolase, non-catalytic subunit [Pleomorphomonas carboxyditropha]|nr:class II D-tagatose-bisphosphate aldolase, non-catalytic subunit [Pleomorphomonas carboxyditropha]